MTHRRHSATPGRRISRLVAWLLLAILGLWLALNWERGCARPVAPPQPADGYLLTVWNVENLYDDRDDPRDQEPLDAFFAANPSALAEKHRLLVDALLARNQGRGPDLLALVEVENRRAVELLRLALNAALPPEAHYPASGLIHHDNISGRRIEPALLTRLPARRETWPDSTSLRILAARVEAEGKPLRLFISHWTSRARSGTEDRRAAYGATLHDAFLSHYHHDPDTDLIVCGDFNDGPGDPSVARHLRAIGDLDRVRSGGSRPSLFNLMASRDPTVFGTYLYRGRWEILDHIVVSPGLLDPRGWRVIPESLRVWNENWLRGGREGGPLRFGNPDNANRRGPSDHFALSVRLRVESGALAAKAPPPGKAAGIPPAR